MNASAPHRRQNQEDQRQVAEKVQAHQERFAGTGSGAVGDEVSHAGDPQVERLQQQREESPCLVAVEQTGDGPACLGLPGGEHQCAGADVGVLVLVVGVGVVAVVLVDPPAVAEPHADVGEHDPERVVGAL
jgi:hypothetical protein